MTFFFSAADLPIKITWIYTTVYCGKLSYKYILMSAIQLVLVLYAQNTAKSSEKSI